VTRFFYGTTRLNQHFLSGSAGSFTGSLAGDVTGTQSTTVVASVGGVAAANVAAGANLANAATSANTPNTLVKRDAIGNVSAGTVTAISFSGSGAGLTNIPASAVVTALPAMALIPAGAFTMGNSVAADTDGFITDAARASTTVSAFYIDVNEVTLSLWQSVYYWATSQGYGFKNAGAGKAANHPVETVDWYDAVKWCNARSEQAGKPPAYYTDAGLTAVYKTAEVPVFVNWTANGYRLPTEAEWEKASRGGVSGQRFPWGDTITQNLANYQGATASYAYDLGPNGYNAIGSVGGTSPATSPVGSFAPNGYGLNDMAGNVSEWVWDCYGTPYAGGTDPKGPAAGTIRVCRGGYWSGGAYNLRCANRNPSGPGSSSSNTGFRTVLPVGQ
jgi:formylglycine-generating enzyme required for sulfatase activity